MLTRLGEYLRDNRLTQEEFALRAKVPGPQVSLWARAVRCPDIGNALKIAAATNGAIPVEYWATVSAARRAKRRRSRAKAASR